MSVITAGTPVMINHEERTTLTTFRHAASDGMFEASRDKRPISDLVMFFKTAHLTVGRGEQPVLAIKVTGEQDTFFVRQTLGCPLSLTQQQTDDTSTLFAAVGTSQIKELLGQLGKFNRANKLHPLISDEMLGKVKQYVTLDPVFK